MNTTTTTEQKMFNLENDFDLIKVNMMDNGDWEYTRLGIGEDVDGKVFLVDTDDHGEEEVVMNFCKEGLTIKDVLKIGVACNVFEKINWGYDKNDQHRVNVDCEGDDWNKFYKLVLVAEEFE